MRSLSREFIMSLSGSRGIMLFFFALIFYALQFISNTRRRRFIMCFELSVIKEGENNFMAQVYFYILFNFSMLLFIYFFFLCTYSSHRYVRWKTKREAMIVGASFYHLSGSGYSEEVTVEGEAGSVINE